VEGGGVDGVDFEALDSGVGGGCDLGGEVGVDLVGALGLAGAGIAGEDY
jgi:hypothetical protein